MSSESAQSTVAPYENWPSLIPLDCPTLPQLDLGWIPSWAGRFSTDLARATETPNELVAAMVLSTCSAATARRLRVCVTEGYYETPNLWCLAALPSGNRKSAVLAAATRPFLTWEQSQREMLEPKIVAAKSEAETCKARVRELRRKAARAIDTEEAAKLSRDVTEIEAGIMGIPRFRRLWTSDATPEKLGQLMAENEECLAWMSAEGGIFDLLQGRYSNGLLNLDLILKAHSGDAERVDRGSREPLFLAHPRLTLGLSPQPDVLRGLAMIPGFRGRGLLARFLYFLPRSPLGFRTLCAEPIRQEVLAEYESQLHAMLDWPPAIGAQGSLRCRTIFLTPNASKLHREFALAMERQMRPGAALEHLTDWASKAPGAAARLATVLHAIIYADSCPWDVELSEDTMERSLEIVAVASEHARYAFQLMGADTVIAGAERIWVWLLNHKVESCTEREIFASLKSSFGRMHFMRPALKVLEERGYIRIIQVKTGAPGRPGSPKVFVRPDFTGTSQ